MYPTKHPSRTGSTVLCLFLALCSGVQAGFAIAGEAHSRKPQRLNELGRRISLKTSSHESEDGAIVITNDSLRRHGSGGTLTIANPSTSPPAKAKKSHAKPQNKRREYWRRKVEAQRRRVDSAERALATHREKVRTLSNAAFDAGHSSRAAIAAWARVERESAKLKPLEETLRKERAILTRIIREARQDGAQPGWFR